MSSDKIFPSRIVGSKWELVFVRRVLINAARFSSRKVLVDTLNQL